jgi:hypothetical protein
MAPINKESSADKLARLLAKAKEMKAAQEALKQSNPQLTEVAAASIIATTPTSE